ncbi:hypothetical protein [Aeromonas sp. MR16]|uniref:hypothetical protein n=1 Tax=Aeromonas sp. MR16 TaxID=2923420 RepID=UPI001F4A4FBA|nr:hypothetical protein [Aeromonas sp. MR16]MCH7373239.1 hypothetical protein [Aeromonas sp. MR16]
MERQTLQQQVPLYHVCPECQGDGCRDCGSMGIVEGDFPSELLDQSIPFSADRELDFNADSGFAQ